MRVGILSKHRVVNYGSFLQAYGLKHMVEKMGHRVRFIDLMPEDGKQVNYLYDEPMWKRLARRVVYGRNLKDYNVFFEARQEMFIDHLFPRLGLSRNPKYDSNYDRVIVGSDEMFNCTEDGTFWGESMQMFGEGIESEKIISYAASFGYTTMARLQERNLDEKVGKLLKERFSAISVRDKNSADIVEGLTGVRPQINLDPVLIYDYSPQMPKKTKYKDYIAVYGYDKRMQEQEVIDQIRTFAKEKGKKLIGVGLWQDWCDENVLTNPFEVMALIRDADYVFCETFHGAVFSIKFNKNFTCFVRQSNYNKLYNLLEQFGLEGRLVTSGNAASELYANAPDYTRANQKIAEERKKTKAYLESCLK